MRTSEGNAQLVWRILMANNADKILSSDGSVISAITKDYKFGGIFVDMQAINEADIQYMGRWRGFTLVPWGTLFRVYGNLYVEVILSLHHDSYRQLQSLRNFFPKVDESFVMKFPPGSWESAAANVYYDAHYQFALFLLTYALEAKPTSAQEFVIVCDRSILASEILDITLQDVRKFGTFSSSISDLEKNTALSWMKLLTNIKIGAKFTSSIEELDLVSRFPPFFIYSFIYLFILHTYYIFFIYFYI